MSLLCDPEGIGISKRRIIVSTSGVVPKIKQLGVDHPGIGLAISLHATTDEIRSQLVPANQQWPIEELIETCKSHPEINIHNRVTFEYVMLKDVNDTDEDAHRLANLIKDFPSFVNIIPFNPWPGSRYESSSNNRIHKFASIIEGQGVQATIRWPRGRDILAACGQLNTIEN